MEHVKQFKSYKSFYNAAEKLNITYTYRIGHIEASPAELIRMFGKPCKSDGYKISGEYFFKIWDYFITIYDWKLTNLYDDGQVSPKDFWKSEERVIFNVGGNVSNVNDSVYQIYCILDLIRSRRLELKSKYNGLCVVNQ